MAKVKFSETIFTFLCKKKLKKRSKSEASVIYSEGWNRFWARMGIDVPDFNNKIVCDYGCGKGYDTQIILKKGAKHVYDLDIIQRLLDEAKNNHLSTGYDNVTYIINNNPLSLHETIGENCIDIIVCRDVMEHVPDPLAVLESMFRILKPGGILYVGLSPFYMSPNGPHFGSRVSIPWIHLIFSEKTILTVFKKLYDLPLFIKRYEDIPGWGVNKMSYFDYTNIVNKFEWKKEIMLINEFPEKRYLQKLLSIFIALLPIKKMKELFIISSYMKLLKSPDCNNLQTQKE